MVQTTPEVEDSIEVTTERLAYGGDAVARFEGLAIFIPLAAPGERLRIRVTEKRKNFARGVIEEILVPSPSRREPPCRYFGDCGGCQLQHIDYRAQLEAKASFVHDALARIGKIDWPDEIEVRSSPEFGYRARAQVKIERLEAGERSPIRIGFTRAASHSVCDVEQCPILIPELDAALGSLRKTLLGSPDITDRVLSGGRIGELAIAAGDSGVSVEPGIAGLPTGNVTRVVCGATYSFTPATFFQGNPSLLEALVEEALGAASGASALELYAGVGLFTVQLARRFERVLAIESDPIASSLARQNLAANSTKNVLFETGRAETVLAGLAPNSEVDFLMLDPPRAGAAGVLNRIIAFKPPRISYVSCDPTTLARDLRVLTASGYDLTSVTAFDLFPQTYHVETVAHLVLR
jgi:23S rRNA (uracil1939-C5)-methyltransferase